jgi:gliding motility-associated-like protein
MDMDLRVNEHPVVSIVGGVACASSPMNFSSTASVKKGFIAKYDWNFGNGGTASQANPIYTYNAPGSYNVVLTVTSDQGCVTSTAALPVTVKVKPKADFTSKYLLSRGFETDWKFDFTGQDADFYNWVFKDGQFASGSGPILATFADTGNFSVYLRVVNSSGCSDSITKYIFLKPELLRHQINAFSPNADNLNDEFAPDKFSFGVTKYRMRIINRWGEILYYTEDPRKGWDGSDSKGGQCPEGAYTYQISFRYIDGKMYTFEGVLMLLK